MKAFLYEENSMDDEERGRIRIAGPIPETWGDLGGSAFVLEDETWDEFLETKKAFEELEKYIIAMAQRQGAKAL